MECKHKWKIKKDASTVEDKVRIHVCEKCGKELIEINGYIHERREIAFPERLL